jgi:cytosine/adenosine deaminase-related metal-dependent hydrolase
MKTSRMLLGVLATCWAVSSFAQTGAQNIKVIQFGKLIDGTSKVVTNASVTVKGDRIESVSAGKSQTPAGAQIIDLSAFTGMPGIVDVHTHMTYWRDTNSQANPNEEIQKLLPQELVFLAQENARKYEEFIESLRQPPYSCRQIKRSLSPGKGVAIYE